MRGQVSSRERCPKCGAKGQYQLHHLGRAQALLCTCKQWAATKPEIVLWWEGKALRITHDQTGRRLEHVEHAARALGLIRSQIEQHAFYPALWTAANTNALLFENYLSTYLEREEARCSKASYRKKTYMARYFLWFSGKNIRDLRTAHVEDFATWKGLNQLSAKTKADILAELQHLLNEAARREEIERAPQVPRITVPCKAIRWMNPDQQAIVLEHIPEHHRPVFMFLMTYGCRVGEVAALAWDKMDMAQGVFYLARTFSLRTVIESTKTRLDNPLPIVDWFQGYLESIPRGFKNTPVFINPEADTRRNPHRYYLPDTLRTIWADALKAAGFPHLPLKNGTRHSRGMAAVNLEGWNMEAVRRLLGHTSQEHTRRYAEAGVELLRDLLNHDKKDFVKVLSRNLNSTNK